MPASRRKLAPSVSPSRLRNEDAEGIIGPDKRLNLNAIKQFQESFEQGIEVRTKPRPNHDAVRIDWLSVHPLASLAT